MSDLTLLAFGIFFLIFLLAVTWALTLPKERVRRLEHLPLEQDHVTDDR